ncbi:updo-like protein [Cladochytrium replicatum]|nr:updo-like protein [Cladochytrium replicatum]
MRQAGRYLPEFRKVPESYDFFTMCRTPSVAAEITIQPIERYGDLLSAAIIFSDILVVPQALGMTVEMLAAKASTKAGAQILQVFDSWGGELSPSDFKTFSLPYIAQIFHRVRARTSVPMVVFARGANESITEVASIGYDVVSVDWCVDPVVARQRAGDKVTLQGNEDPSLLYADADVIRDRVRTMIGKFGMSKYIGNLGHGMYPDHDPEKLKVYLEAIRDVSLEMNSTQESQSSKF